MTFEISVIRFKKFGQISAQIWCLRGGSYLQSPGSGQSCRKRNQNSKLITITSININNLGCGGKLDDIIVDKPDIVCVQEVMASNSKLPDYRGYRWVTHNTKNRGTAILVNNDSIPAGKCSKKLHPSHHACMVKLNKDKKLRLINCYLPVSNGNNKIRHENALKNIEKYITNHCIITGDMNGWIHSHNGRLNEHGKNLDTFKATNNLDILPKKVGTHSRIDSRGHQTTVDYFLSKNVKLTPQITSGYIPSTDHRAITSSIKYSRKQRKRSKNKLIRPIHKLQNSSEHRHKYRDLLKERRPNWQSTLPNDIDEAADSLDDVILTTFDDILGKKWIRTDRNKSWWDSDYLAAKRDLMRLEKKCKSKNGEWISEEAKFKYLSSQKSLRKLCNLKKRTSMNCRLREMNKHYLSGNNKWRNIQEKYWNLLVIQILKK